MNKASLEEVAKIYTGNSINATLKKERYTDKKFSTPYVATKDLNKIGTFKYDNGITIPDDELGKFRIAPKGATLICMEGGSAGKKIGVVDQDVCFVNKLGALVPKETIKSKYLFYALQSNEFQRQFQSCLTGIIGGVSLTKLKKLQIPVPSLQEQEKIVERLDKVFENKYENLSVNSRLSASYVKLKNSILKEIFDNLFNTYQISLLGDVTTVKSGGTPKKSNIDYWNGDINWLSSGELDELHIDYSNEQITQLGLDNSSAKIFPEGSLLVGMYDTAAFKMSIINSPMAFNQAICGIQPNRKIDILFIYYQLQFLKNKILKQRVGVRQQNLNLSKMRNIEIVIPDIKIQIKISRQISDYFSFIDELSNNKKNTAEKIPTLMQSYLNKEFSYE